MQLVEQGKLDLDAPIERALPEFRIAVPFDDAAPITARQLLCHRSGMIRECPLGGYLDDRQPTLAATVASVAACTLVNPPNSKTRYSNVGPTIVGRAIEVQSGEPFAEYQQRHVLRPLRMTSSAWTMTDALRPRCARGMMRVAQGDGTYAVEAAPRFELGTLPAGNLYTTAPDLARFAAFLMSTGSAETQPCILLQESLDKMLKVQLSDEATGFGLGFLVGKYRGHRTIQHTGAVFGFTTSIVVLPREKIGAIVLASADIATAGVRRLSERALDLLLEAVHGEALPEPPPRAEFATGEMEELAGEYESASYWVKLGLDGTTLRGEMSGQPIELTAIERPLRFVADGRLLYRSPVEFARNADGRISGFAAAGQQFRRLEPDKVAPAPPAWQNLVGVYGPKFIPLVVTIRHGHLYATVENEYDYRLTPLNRVTFNLPPGMYADEHAVFETAASGKASGVIFANMHLERRPN
jgi:serine beta-lactamase-like protein LACTB